MIIALKEQSRVYLAADSLFRDGEELYYNHQKIVECHHNQVLMAGCGNPKIVQEIIHGFKYPGTIPDKQLCSDYLNSLHENYRKEMQYYFQFLIIGDGRIIHINSKGLVAECPHYEVIGVGREMAMVGLELTGDLPPDVRLHAIFTAISKHTTTIGGNIDVKFV